MTAISALNRRLEYHGEVIGRMLILQDAYKESVSQMPDDEYEHGGFKWLQDNPQYIPKVKMRETLRISSKRAFGPNTMWIWFRAWRQSGQVLWVLRFKGYELKTELLNKPAQPGLTLDECPSRASG